MTFNKKSRSLFYFLLNVFDFKMPQKMQKLKMCIANLLKIQSIGYFSRIVIESSIGQLFIQIFIYSNIKQIINKKRLTPK